MSQKGHVHTRKNKGKTMLGFFIISCLMFFGCENRSSPPPLNLFSKIAGAPTPASRPTPPISAKSRQTREARIREQTVFALETDIEHPVSLPPDVLQILRKDKGVQQRSLKEGESIEHITATLFLASEIDLNGDKLPDLIVTGSPDSNLLGANITVYWIFHHTPQGYHPVLRINTFGLEVLKSKTNGFRNIEAASQSAVETNTQLYTFSGKKYRLKRYQTKRIQ